jgi:hypothetical protein
LEALKYQLASLVNLYDASLTRVLLEVSLALLEMFWNAADAAASAKATFASLKVVKNVRNANKPKREHRAGKRHMVLLSLPS